MKGGAMGGQTLLYTLTEKEISKNWILGKSRMLNS
jgi:hypothetical protein